MFGNRRSVVPRLKASLQGGFRAALLLYFWAGLPPFTLQLFY